MNPPTTMSDKPLDPDFEARVRENFGRQRMMRTLGAELLSVEPGMVTIGMGYCEDLTQQHGYMHAGGITAIVDSACGYAALTLMEPGKEVLAVEFKINLLRPAAGERFVATAKVLRAGRTLTVCSGEVHAENEGNRKLVAAMQATMIAIDPE